MIKDLFSFVREQIYGYWNGHVTTEAIDRLVEI